jgi:hypothetical protein
MGSKQLSSELPAGCWRPLIGIIAASAWALVRPALSQLGVKVLVEIND